MGKIRVGAVSYLNTVPLVWGMVHGVQRSLVDLTFSVPSQCADQLESGHIEVGILPVAEIARQGLEIISNVGIACRGPVRSILLCARKPWREVRTLAADASSRTSVQLARLILRERYGVEPNVTSVAPELDSMLQSSDAALIIGDPALRIEPSKLAWEYLDLGAEWFALTGLPMVFAAWAGKPGLPVSWIAEITTASYEFGRAHLDEIIEAEYGRRNISKDLAAKYLNEHIRFQIGPEEQRGLHAFLELARLEPAVFS